ncbi:MAG: hypothetical protein PHG82_03120 [Candidatus Gracilibacteria bacterium]|nr:hypothetical protein [Candidatus Gracilibacteria bacterium]
MATIKQNESPNLETTKVSIETKNNQNDSLKLAKEDVLKAYKGYDLFKQSLLSDPNYKKDAILQILEKVDEMDLQMYLDSNVDDGNLVNLKINDFIVNFKGLTVEKKEEKKIDLMINSNDSKKDFIKNKTIAVKNETIAVKNETIQKENGLKTLNEKLPKLKELFKGDIEIENILNQIDANKENPNEVLKLVNQLLSTKEKATKFFDKIAATGDKELYESTYKSFENLGVSIPAYIPKAIYEIKKEKIGKDPRFPDAPDGKVEKRGDLLSFGDKLIDERTGKAYIISNNGYKLETSLNVPNLTEMKVEHQEKRLELLETINTDKKILELLGNKKKIKKDIEDLEKQKKGGLGEDTGVNIAINLLQKELEQIQAKLAVAVPNYRENQDDLLASFLETSIKENEENLAKLEEKYRKDLSELYTKSADKVKENDEATRETTRFLDLIGFSMLPQEITDRIIKNVINTSERSKPEIAELGFVNNLHPGKSDLLGLNGLMGDDIIKQKKAFLKMFNKMMTGEMEKPIPTSDTDLLNSEKNISNKYKQEINAILFKEPFEGSWKQGIMESNLYKTNKNQSTNTNPQETTNKEK